MEDVLPVTPRTALGAGFYSDCTPAGRRPAPLHGRLPSTILRQGDKPLRQLLPSLPPPTPSQPPSGLYALYQAISRTESVAQRGAREVESQHSAEAVDGDDEAHHSN